MNKKIGFLVVLALVFGIASSAWSIQVRETLKTGRDGRLVGTWTSSSQGSYTFNSNGNFVCGELEGTYTTNGNSIFFNVIKYYGRESSMKFSGTYSINGNNLTIVLPTGTATYTKKR